ncbi:MAG: peptide ABC transporter permease, partial [Actinobacteria bacterium]|nr:peptide ABC transporter permease [Actinomycetota bacterium]
MTADTTPATTAGADGLSGDRLSRGTLIRRRFFRNKLAVFGLTVVVFMFVMAFVGPYLTQWSYTDNDFDNLLSPPSSVHWFGTTQVGVDVFAQTMRGLQKSLIIGLLVAIFSTSLSAFIGSVAGYL